MSSQGQPGAGGDFSFPALQRQQQQSHAAQSNPFGHQQQQQQPQPMGLQPPAAQVVLQQPVKPWEPLTARSTVVHATATSQASRPANGSMPAPAPAPPKPKPVTQVQAEGRRNKVPLEKGFSQVSWLKLTRSNEDLTGGHGHGRRDITLEEVQQHRTADDAWMVLHGKVYNITPYIRFHPGGADILIKAAGKDATSLFNRYHPWVNAHGLLERCMIGSLEKPGGGAEGEQPSGIKSRLSKLLCG